MEIPGYPGYYACENGDIFTTRRGTLKKKAVCRTGPKRYSYHGVVLMKNGRGKTRKVHQLILETFVGPREVGMESLHLSKNRFDNSLKNLRYGTKKENIEQMKDDRTKLVGEMTNNVKLKNEDIFKIRKMKGSSTIKRMAEIFYVNPSTIDRIIHRRTWKHI